MLDAISEGSWAKGCAAAGTVFVTRANSPLSPLDAAILKF